MAITLRKTYVKDGQLVVEEVVDDRVLANKKTKFNNGGFITLFQKALMEISLNANLSKGAFRLLIYLIAKTEIDNEVKISLYQIAKDLKVNQGNTVSFFKELEDLNIAVRDKIRRTIRLNYDLAWSGKIKDYKKVAFTDPKIMHQSLDWRQRSIEDEIAERKREE
jgi:DNA-binding MarR family transcriptional regulator